MDEVNETEQVDAVDLSHDVVARDLYSIQIGSVSVDLNMSA